MIGAELLRRALDEAIEHGRTTREDTAQLTAVVVQIGSRQGRDTLARLEPLLAPALRSAGWARRAVLGRRPR
jgi:small ligand-binding sensory domain FIST